MFTGAEMERYMKIAARTHDFGRQKIEELPQVLKRQGIEAAQLVLPKAFLEFDSYEDISDRQIARIGRSFHENEMKIHILGCYMDFGNPDKDIRRKAVKNFSDCLVYSKELGAYMVGTETAYPHLNEEEKKIWFPYMLDSLQRLVEVAEREKAFMALEPVGWHPLCNLEVTQEVFEKLDSEYVKMIFDPANVYENQTYKEQDDYWLKWLNTMGDKIEAIHLKDFCYNQKMEYQPMLLGEGIMKYDAIISWLKEKKKNIVIVREEIDPKTAEQDIAFIKKIWKEGR